MLAFILSLLLLVLPQQIHAVYDPLSVSNNKYGMHIADFSDIADVATLVNSSGGDWGYITLVASDNDRDFWKWQQYFDQMRRLHLIPIVRIATHVNKNHWIKPDPDRFDEIVDFFTKLNWPVQNRYIVLFNEPNHANEWGGSIDPVSFCKLSVDLAKKFHAASDYFFMLPAGLDVSAATDASSMDAAQFLKEVVQSNPDYFSYFDGWTSHSYPNPAFSGSPNSFGRGTIRSYDWELSYAKSLGLSKKLPVFITETGWIRGTLSSETIGMYLQAASTSAWTDPRIVAITPFVFNYQDVPFDGFSWKKLSKDGGFYPQYDSYRMLLKIKGEPIQFERYTLVDTYLPSAFVANSTYTLNFSIRNDGQGMLSPDAYEVALESETQGFTVVSYNLPTLEPNEKGTFSLSLQAPKLSGTHNTLLSIKRFNRKIELQRQTIQVVDPPSIELHATLGWKQKSDAEHIDVLVYDHETLLHKFSNLSMKNGIILVDELQYILPGTAYRVVVLVPNYLPRQSIHPLKIGKTTVTVKRLLPLDFNQDGTFTTLDLFAMIKLKPNFILSLFLGP